MFSGSMLPILGMTVYTGTSMTGLVVKLVGSIPYSGKFSLVQIFAKKRAVSSEEIFAVSIFADAGLSGHTPIS